MTWRRNRGDSRLRSLLATAAALSMLLVSSPAAPRASADGVVRVILQGVPGSMEALERAVERLGGEVGARLPIIHGLAAAVPESRADQLAASPGVSAITPDRRVELSGGSRADYTPTGDAGSLYNVARSIGAQRFWEDDVTGEGVDVALIDSGVVPVSGLKQPDKVVNGPDISFESQAPDRRYLDTFGHGTHMAGIIAGRDGAVEPGKEADDTQNFLGIAPDAGIVNVKVASANGATDVSQVIAAIGWVVAHRNDPGVNIEVLNLSFGTDADQSYLVDPLAYAAEVAWHEGIVVVVAAGNRGFGDATMNNPAHDPYLLAVGAADHQGTETTADDVVPDWSSKGDGTRNPDLVAPGKSIVSLRDPGSFIDARNPEARVGERFFLGSGTSQAAAVVSGAAALVIDQYDENITPDEVKKLLTSTANPLPLAQAGAKEQGSGMLDLERAHNARVVRGATQPWEQSTGTGTLEGARGTAHVEHLGEPLDSNDDIFGASCCRGASWSSGTYNGDTWTGDGWDGESWTTKTWGAADWGGLTWAGDTWSGVTWSGVTWSGDTWSGDTWSGDTWSGVTWSGDTWSGVTWSGVTWSSAGWGTP